MVDFKKELALSIESALGGKFSVAEIKALIEVPPTPDMGDYALPCFRLCKALKKSPDEVSKDLAENMMLPEGIENLEPKGPYLNFFVGKEILAKDVLKEVLTKKDNFGKSTIARGQRLMVEYSGPNSNKPLHLGHLRNNSLGMAIANIAAANGFDVVKANIINDRGIHICKSMLAYQLFGKGTTPEKQNIKPDHLVGHYYVLYNQKVEKDKKLEEQAYSLLKKWEAKDRQTRALWKKMTGWALAGFKQTYKEFGSKFDVWFYESDFYDKAKPLLALGKKKGVFEKNEDGALVAQLEKHGLPNKTVLRADGTSIYITNDLAVTKHKFKEFKLNESLWVVGSEQDLYFRQLFKIFALLGFSWARNCRHLSHGMVTLPSGKLKSREGKVVDADDIISELEELAENEINKREVLVDEKDKKRRGRAVGLSALKFHMLKVAVQKDILFDPKESISFEGETGPYVQYTYARAKSILRKAGHQGTKSFGFMRLIGPEEQKIIKILETYPATVLKSLEYLSPHIICQYLIELSEAFNSFYHKHKVLQAGSEEIKHERLALVQATAQVIKNGLSLLDIEAIEKM